ncbi:hypothetical protein HF086_005411 [Spodoptera exigua]|uniref:Exocyst complex component Sec3 C-terminal domain-containing protein n=1 Tax=Spodoptera exigua TaxID=7107 RepID=A0A922MBB1_SPOEX|nr:hypothetical protein HF086_005411 [Spodoptera exigua]
MYWLPELRASYGGDMSSQAAKKPKCGLLSFLQELEALSDACERIFVSSGRRADLERWYVSLAGAMLHAIQHAEHPRTPRAVLHMGECPPSPLPRPDLERWYVSLAGAMLHAIQHAEHPRTPRAVLHMGECPPPPLPAPTWSAGTCRWPAPCCTPSSTPSTRARRAPCCTWVSVPPPPSPAPTWSAGTCRWPAPCCTPSSTPSTRARRAPCCTWVSVPLPLPAPTWSAGTCRWPAPCCTPSSTPSTRARRAPCCTWVSVPPPPSRGARRGLSVCLPAENYHRLHGVLSALRVPALESLRRECRARYSDALRAYVTQYFGRPLEKLTQFFEGVAEAVAQGVREDEVCYRAAFSKHELRRVLAMYPAHEVRKSLHRLYRTVEKHLSEEGGLLQVVWRAMQEEFIAQHVALQVLSRCRYCPARHLLRRCTLVLTSVHPLQARIAACYPAAGLALPLTTQHILDAFSDIAREH